MNLKIIDHSKFWISLSALLVISSIVLISVLGLKQGIDFTGGTLLEIEFNSKPDVELVKDLIKKVETEPALAIDGQHPEDTATTELEDTEDKADVTTDNSNNEEPIDSLNDEAANTEVTTDTESANEEMSEELSNENLWEETATTTETQEEPLTEYSELNPEGIVEIGTPVIQTTGDNSLMIRIKYINEDTHKQIIERLKEANNGVAVTELRYENIGPVIGKTLKQNAFISLALAIIFIIIFISFAFRKMPRTVSSFKFGVTAVIAIVHDVLVIVATFAILGAVLNIEIDTLFITALLTVMGFSVHDTIVVFDRIRENLFRSKGKTFEEIANDSINQTLARSINTSLTTLITLFALFILGGESIKWFVFALIVGIIVGTYSSIFLATPFLVMWHKKK